jgi:hypothetical protein
MVRARHHVRQYGEMFVRALPLRLTVVVMLLMMRRRLLLLQLLLLLRGGRRGLVHGVLARWRLVHANFFLPLLLVQIGKQLILPVPGEIWIVVKTGRELFLKLAVFGFVTLHE